MTTKTTTSIRVTQRTREMINLYKDMQRLQNVDIAIQNAITAAVEQMADREKETFYNMLKIKQGD